MEGKKRKEKILYKDLSYKIVGIIFEVYNDLGFGYKERHYENAIEIMFKNNNIDFIRQAPFKIAYQGSVIGRYFMDFVIDDKIVLELKQGDHFSRKNIEQVYKYLLATELKLGIIANFTKNGIKYKRILNIK